VTSYETLCLGSRARKDSHVTVILDEELWDGALFTDFLNRGFRNADRLRISNFSFKGSEIIHDQIHFLLAQSKCRHETAHFRLLRIGDR
jgi:hypothetical protein